MSTRISRRTTSPPCTSLPPKQAAGPKSGEPAAGRKPLSTLAPTTRGLFPGLIHVRDVGLKQASDETIWDWAKRNSYTIVTTDADFAALSGSRGWPPKVIHLEECDFPLRIVE